VKKLALNLEQLSVQSFTTAETHAVFSTDPIGTGETEPDMCFTCEMSCGRNC
jgi:hypothetical protein